MAKKWRAQGSIGGHKDASSPSPFKNEATGKLATKAKNTLKIEVLKDNVVIGGNKITEEKEEVSLKIETTAK